MAIKATLSTTYVDAPEDVYNAKSYAEQAAASASAAKTSASNAATSESNAKTSASSSGSSAAAAKTSETNAKASEKAAASSADTAKTSQSAAASSASQAEISATNAANSATDAANSAASLTYATADEAKTGIADNRIISPNTLKSTINYMTNQLQRNKKYAVSDIAYSPNLPSWAYLECITAGTTGYKEPDFSNVVSTGSAIADMADGNTHWRVRDTRCRYEVGDIIAKTATPKSYEYLLPCNGGSFDKTKYPLLAKVFTDGKVPNLTDGRFLEGSTASGTNKSAGLPNIFGLIGGGSGAGNGSGNGMFRSNQLTGAFASNGKDNYGEQYPVFSQSKSWPDGIPIIQAKFDASLANPIYGSSSTVQPKSYTVVYYVCYGG